MISPGRPKILLIEPMYHADGEQMLAAHARLETLRDAAGEQIREAIKTASAVVVRYPSRLKGDAIREGRNLLVISTSGRGTDAIDIAAATEQGVAVVNNPGLGSVPVSEHTIALMLDLAKQITQTDSIVRRNLGWADRQSYRLIELQGKTVGIIGLGNIGAEVGRKCVSAFGMRALAYDPYVTPEKAASVGATLIDELDEIFRESHFVSLHPELNDETRGMIGEAELQKMRRDAFLINTARGPVVRQDALVRALREGWIRGAAIDVFDPEPPAADSPLYTLDNLILTPHVAGLTGEALRELALSAANQVLQVLRGERPLNLINHSVWDRVLKRIADGQK